MSWHFLLRRREFWVPSLWSWLFILIICTSLLVLAGLHIHSFLSAHQPSGARLLVVEGWIQPKELDQAIERFRAGDYNRIITTGGPVSASLYFNQSTSYAVLARDYLVRRGLPADSVIAVPAPASAQDRSYLSAVMVRFWLSQSGQTIDAVDVFSSGVHSRRTRAVYRMAFGPDVRIGIFAAHPAEYDPVAWWKTSIGAKTVITELISWIWTELFFWPEPPGSHEEKWGQTTSTQSAQ